MSNYVERLDTVLVMIYTFLHLVQADQTQAKANFGKPDFYEAPAKEINGDDIVTSAQVYKTKKLRLALKNCEKTSDGCYAIPRDEQFRRSAMAFYKQTKSLK